MKIKEIKNLQGIYEAIIKLDGEIIALDKRAVSLAKEDQTAKLSLIFDKSLEPVAESAPDLVMVDFGFGPMRAYPVNSFPAGGCPFPGVTVNTPTALNMTLTDIETLYVVDALIVCKKQKRRELIQQLKDFGFTL